MKKDNKAFTLTEIIIVIAILTILFSLVLSLGIPFLVKKSRDTQRYSDLYKISLWIESLIKNDPSFNEFLFTSSNTVYISLADSSSTCGSYSSLPSLPSGLSYRCTSSPSRIDGSGWIPFQFVSSSLADISKLFIDPINKPPYYYSFILNDDGYELTAKAESFDGEIVVPVLKSKITPFNRGGTWMKKIFCNYYSNSFSSVNQTFDGDYLISGYTTCYGEDRDVIIIRTDIDKNKFIKYINSIGDDYLYDIKQTSDGGYVTVGLTRGYEAYGDAFIFKLNSAGSSVFSKVIGTLNYEDAFSSVEELSDGSYILSGYSKGLAPYIGNFEGMVAKISSTGSLLWAKKVSGLNEERINNIIQTFDGGYLLSGITNSYGAGSYDGLILKLDQSANLSWAKTFGGTSTDYFYLTKELSDGNYLAVGYTNSLGAGEEDFLVVKFDAFGNLIWSRIIGGSSQDVAKSFFETSDGGYVILGYTKSFKGSSDSDGFIVKLSKDGDFKWAKTIDLASQYEVLNSGEQTSDGGYLIVGETVLGGGGRTEGLVLKLDSRGNLNECSQSKEVFPQVNTSSLAVSNVNLTFSPISLYSNSLSVVVQDVSLPIGKICPEK